MQRGDTTVAHGTCLSEILVVQIIENLQRDESTVNVLGGKEGGLEWLIILMLSTIAVIMCPVPGCDETLHYEEGAVHPYGEIHGVINLSLFISCNAELSRPRRGRS